MQYFIILLFVGTIPACILSQNAPVQLWQSGEYVENVQIKSPTIKQDKFLNTFMITNQGDVNPLGGMTLVKYDTTGNLLWNVNYPPGIVGHFYGSFILDNLGSSYVSLSFDGGLPEYDADAILLKYSSEGEILWEKNYGLDQAGDGYINYSGLDSLGRLIILGRNQSNVAEEDNFLLLACLDTSAGEIIWEIKIPGIYFPANLKVLSDRIEALAGLSTPNGPYFSIIQTDFNGQILQQSTKSYGDYSFDFNNITKSGNILLGNRSYGYEVDKLNTEGDSIWHYRFQDGIYSSRNWVRSVVEDDSMFVYATGAVELPGLATEFVTTKFSPDGDVLWQNIYHSHGDSLGESGEYITVDKNFVYASGGTKLADTDAVGLIKVYNKNSGDDVYNITLWNNNIFIIEQTVIQDNKIYYVGTGFENSISQQTVYTGCIQLPKITTTSKNEALLLSISLYPNPASDWVHITDIDTELFKWAEIYDMSGQLIRKFEVKDDLLNIPISSLPAGTYVISVEGNDIRLEKLIVKQ